MKPDLIRHGRGLCIWSDGSYYMGQYQNDLNDGYGILHYPNGDEIEVLWVKGKMHGKGFYKKSDGAIYDIEYENGFILQN